MFLLTKYQLFVFQLAAAIGVGTIQTAAVNNRVDETNRRVGTSENDIKKSKADITTQGARISSLETTTTSLSSTSSTSSTSIINVCTVV